MLSRGVAIAFQTELGLGQSCTDWNEGTRGRLITNKDRSPRLLNSIYYTALKLRMMSCILSVPGSSVGELLLTAWIRVGLGGH